MRNSTVERVKEKIMDSIAAGNLPEGGKLQSVRILCNDYGTSKNTICKALADLAKMGILHMEDRKVARVKAWKGEKVAIVYASLEALRREPFWREFYIGIKERFAEAGKWKLETLNTGTMEKEAMTAKLNPEFFSGIICLSTDLYGILENSRSIFKLLPGLLVNIDYPCGHLTEICADFSEALKPVEKVLRKMETVRCLFFVGSEYYRSDILKSMKYREIVRILQEAFPDRKPQIELLVAQQDNDIKLFGQLVRMFKNKDFPNFCVAYTDRDVPFLLRAMHDANRKCPEDVMLLSYDNLTSSMLTIPSQTTIDMNRREMGRLAADTMIHMLQKEPVEKVTYVKAKLVERESLICGTKRKKRVKKGMKNDSEQNC